MDHTSIIVYQRSASHRCLAGCALLQPSLVCRADMVLSRGRAISSPTAFIKMLQTNRGGGEVSLFLLPSSPAPAVPSHAVWKTLERAYPEMDNRVFNTQVS